MRKWSIFRIYTITRVSPWRASTDNVSNTSDSNITQNTVQTPLTDDTDKAQPAKVNDSELHPPGSVSSRTSLDYRVPTRVFTLLWKMRLAKEGVKGKHIDACLKTYRAMPSIVKPDDDDLIFSQAVATLFVKHRDIIAVSRCDCFCDCRSIESSRRYIVVPNGRYKFETADNG